MKTTFREKLGDSTRRSSCHSHFTNKRLT